MGQPQLSARLQSHLFGRIFPLLVGVSAVAMAISCAKDNKTNVNKTGAGSTADAQAAAKSLFNYDPTTTENVNLSSRVEGITVTAKPSGQAATQTAPPDQTSTAAGVQAATGVDPAPAPTATATAASFDVRIQILVDDPDSTKPAHKVMATGTVRGQDTSNAASPAEGIMAVTSSTATTTPAAPQDGTTASGAPASTAAPATAAAPDGSTTSGTKVTATKPGMFSLSSESGTETVGTYSVYVKCSDAQCTQIHVRLGEKAVKNDATEKSGTKYFARRVVFAYSSNHIPANTDFQELKLIWSGQNKTAAVVPTTTTPTNGSKTPPPVVQGAKRIGYSVALQNFADNNKPVCGERGVSCSTTDDGSAAATATATAKGGNTPAPGASGGDATGGVTAPSGGTPAAPAAPATPGAPTDGASQEMTAAQIAAGGVGIGSVSPSATVTQPPVTH